MAHGDDAGAIDGEVPLRFEEPRERRLAPVEHVFGVLDGAGVEGNLGAETVFGRYDDEVVGDEIVDLVLGDHFCGAEDEAAGVEDESWGSCESFGWLSRKGEVERTYRVCFSI